MMRQPQHSESTNFSHLTQPLAQGSHRRPNFHEWKSQGRPIQIGILAKNLGSNELFIDIFHSCSLTHEIHSCIGNSLKHVV
jgi:hypothetical protein